MIRIEEVDIWGFKHAIRGMRNPLNSWDRSDSYFEDEIDVDSKAFSIGDNDEGLMERLSKAGHPHRKYLRQIMVSCDITAPLYWWKEFDTYKVGTTANSTSTMHKIHSRELVMDDFSHDHLNKTNKIMLQMMIDAINNARTDFLDTKDHETWYQMIQLLPSSYNQTRTVTMNYENLLNMLEYRKNHKLQEWKDFCKWILTLPMHQVLEVGCLHE